jgi:hypothetical protein
MNFRHDPTEYKCEHQGFQSKFARRAAEIYRVRFTEFLMKVPMILADATTLTVNAKNGPNA